MTETHLPRMGVPDELMTRLSMAEQHEYLTSMRPSRRNLLRAGAVLVGGAAVSGLGAASATAAPAIPSVVATNGRTVAPFARHLAFGADPQTQMSIAWQTAVPVKGAFVRIPLNLGERVPAEVRAVHSEVPGAIAPVDQYYLHVDLKHLNPGTRCYHGVGHMGFDPASAELLSTLGQFQTAHRRTKRVPRHHDGDCDRSMATGLRPTSVAGPVARCPRLRDDRRLATGHRRWAYSAH